MIGIIEKMLSGFYYVKTPSGIITCRARGIMRKKGITPLVGDKVRLTLNSDGSGNVDEILPRKNHLVRPPVANVDKAFIVSAYSSPAPNFYIIDTMLAICEHNNITPILVFNKCDLGDFSEYVRTYELAGYKVIVTSAADKSGLCELGAELEGVISVFTGNSGVGKSSLLNTFLGDVIKTGEVSEKLGRGRHTTRHTELYEVAGGYVADTAGFSSIEIDMNDYSFKERLEYCFKEFEQYIGRCKFTGCSHIGENGCAVCEAAENGFIAKTRIESYKSLYNELKDLKKWQISKK